MDINKILDKFGLKQEQLSQDEKTTLENWVSAIQQNEITVDKVREFVEALIDSVEKEITEYNPKSITEYLFLKKRQSNLHARLRCYLMLRDFLSTPARAQKALEKAILNIKQ